jgi:signal transduction histidine kinase
LVLFTLAVALTLLGVGSRLILKTESARLQMQALESLGLAAREATLQHEDVAVMNLMRHTALNPSVLYTGYANPQTGVRLVYPQGYRDEISHFPPPPSLVATSRPLTLQNGEQVVEWYRSVGNTNPPGYVSVAYSRKALDEAIGGELRRWTGAAAVATAAALLLGWLAAWVVARHLADPLKRIRDGTRLVRSGQLGSLVAVHRPDEIGDLAQDFNAMVLQLKDLDEMKRDFVAGVTHDLGTPLHAIRSATNYLQAGDAGPLTDKQAEYLLMISNSTQHLIAFINNLLTVSRIEAARLEPYFEPVDVMAHASELVALYQAQAREKDVVLKLTRKVPYVSLVADVTMFRQIVMNLISNALKFTSHGTVEVVLTEEDGDFLLEVCDTGIGVDAALHSLIFDKFFRVKQPKDFPVQQGSGLGLSIVKGLAEAHGGNISLESSLGKGSIFRVRLPKQPRPTRWYGGKPDHTSSAQANEKATP